MIAEVIPKPTIMDDSYNLRNLSIVSYNCRGYNDVKCQYIKSVLNTCNPTIMLLQEHWLSDDQLRLLGHIDSNFLSVGVSGFANRDILNGGPYGGCAIIWKADLACTVDALATNSNRICAMRIVCNAFKLLIIAVYMPYEGGPGSTADYTEELSVIESLINLYDDCHVIVGGDFNVDFSRDASLHTAMLHDFCANIDLRPAITHANSQVDFTYHFNMDRYSVIDHFMLSSVLFDSAIKCVSVIHDTDNISDHEPVVIELSLVTQFFNLHDKVYTVRPSWVRAVDIDRLNYKCALSHNLHYVKLPTDALLCKDLRCSNASHIQDINDYAQSISAACVAAAEATIPASCNRKTSGRIPGWIERVQPLREKSLFWHRIWLDCDRPKQGAVAEIMRRTRAAYHYAIRNARKYDENIVRERIADSLLNDGGRNFWAEIKRIRNRNIVKNSSTVDGLTDANEIAHLFAAKYKELYTCVSYNKGDMQALLGEVNGLVHDTAITSDCFFRIGEVRAATARLKSGKSEGRGNLSSDHIINAGDDSLVHIACLFSTMAVHGVVANTFLASTIIPIPKSRHANPTKSENYRGIALSSLYGKILDSIILERYKEKLMSCELQFGFKAKSSTNMCSMVLKETIAYYTQHDSSVFCTFLDATKAFDRLHYCKLFRLLIKRDLPAL
jgi:exonuclease III